MIALDIVFGILLVNRKHCKGPRMMSAWNAIEQIAGYFSLIHQSPPVVPVRLCVAPAIICGPKIPPAFALPTDQDEVVAGLVVVAAEFVLAIITISGKYARNLDIPEITKLSREILNGLGGVDALAGPLRLPLAQVALNLAMAVRGFLDLRQVFGWQSRREPGIALELDGAYRFHHSLQSISIVTPFKRIEP